MSQIPTSLSAALRLFRKSRNAPAKAAVIVALCAAACLPIQSGLAQPRAKDELVVVIASTLNTLNPTQTLNVGSDMSAIGHIYSPLVRRDAKLDIKPALAASWNRSDATTWRFKLVRNVKFANGEVLDAAAVKWNLEYVLDKKNKARLQALFAPVIDKITAVSPDVLEIKTREPYLPLLQLLVHVYLMPPKWASAPGRDLSREVMGTGPYELKENTAGSRVVLEAKPTHFEGKPKINRVVMRTITEPSSRVAALLAGEVDYINNIPYTDIDRINKSGKARASLISGSRTMFLHLNTLKPPFKDNVALRQALNYAVDKEAIVKSLYGGRIKPSGCQVIQDNNFGYQHDLKPYPYSKEKARQKLAEAGYPNGLTIKLDVPMGRYLQADEISQIVASQLEEVGIKVEMTQADFGGWLTRYVGQKIEMATYTGLGSITFDADFTQTAISTGSYSYWRNPQFEALVAKARSRALPEERQALYKQTAELLCEQAPFLFLFDQPLIYATSNRVEWAPRNDDWLLYGDFKVR